MTRESSEPRWLWWTLAACCIVVVFAPVIISARPAPVFSLALVGTVVAVIVGIGAAVTRIAWTHGKPLGERDPMLDASSPYLRRSNRWRRLLALGLIGFSIGDMVFAVYWYPRPHPFLPLSSEDYILSGLVLSPFLLGFGIYFSIIDLYWSRVVRRARRASLNHTSHMRRLVK